MTFEGTFLETIADIVGLFGGLWGPPLASLLDTFDRELGKGFCCSAEEAKKWTNCAWHGEPGTCFDNHCDTGHQVQLAESAYGLGLSCFPRLERTRAFCCDPADGKSLFMPVPLEYLFKDPPPKDTADIDVKLQTDPTWGTGTDKGSDEPNVRRLSSLFFSPVFAVDSIFEYGFLLIGEGGQLTQSFDICRMQLLASSSLPLRTRCR